MNSRHLISNCRKSTHSAVPSLASPKQQKFTHLAVAPWPWLAIFQAVKGHNFGTEVTTLRSSVRLAATTHYSVNTCVDYGRRYESREDVGSLMKTNDLEEKIGVVGSLMKTNAVEEKIGDVSSLVKTNELEQKKGDAGSLMKTDYLEEKIEKVIYRCRFMTFLGVAGSLMGSVICFLKGCEYVIDTFREHLLDSGKAVLLLIEAIDIYLVGTVMLVFGMGLYELFISNLDTAKLSSHRSSLLGLFRLPERPQWLEIQSVNELKTKLGHVIVTVLLVGMVEKMKKVTISSPTDMLCFAASILLCSVCLYLLSKLQTTKELSTPTSNFDSLVRINKEYDRS